MLTTWSKQFIAATGLFSLLLLTVTMNLFLKEQQLVEKQLQDKKTFQASSLGPKNPKNTVI